MSVGDVGADEYGNVTRLSTSQQQYYIGLAKSLGASQADIDSFIHNNGYNDLGRIVSALGLSGSSPSSAPGSGVGTSSYAAAIYATPTPVSSSASLAVASPSDGQIVGSAAGGGSGSDSLSVTVASPAAGAPVVVPASRIPAWAIVLGAAVLVLVFLERK